METDYKIVEEKADSAGNITYQRVRFYEGATTTENEFDVLSNSLIPVTRYRRTLLIQEVEYTYGI